MTGSRRPTIDLGTEAHLAAGGDAVARAEDGRVVFVRGGAPEERLEAVVVQENPTFLRAEMSRIIEPSRFRTTPRCEHFGRCGGCTLQHVDPQAQVASKSAALADSLRRIGGFDASLYRVAEPWTGSPYAYRARARIAVARSAVPRGEVPRGKPTRDEAIRGRWAKTERPRGERAKGERAKGERAVASSPGEVSQGARCAIGFRGVRTNDVVDVVRCPVLVPSLDGALTTMRSLIAARSPPARPLEISMLAVDSRVEIVLPSELSDLSERLENAGLVVAHSVEEAAFVRDHAGPVFRSALVFCQSNPEGNDAMLSHVEELLEGLLEDPLGTAVGPSTGAGVVELYAGSGNFTRPLSHIARRVVAIEESSDACALLGALELPRVEVRKGVVETVLRRLVEGEGSEVAPELVFATPPREGLSAEALALVLRLAPRVMIYVSCAPATFARDVSRLAKGGLRLEALRMFDLYPETPHLELVAAFRSA